MNRWPTNSVSPQSTVAAGDIDQFLSVGKTTPVYQGTDINGLVVVNGLSGWYQPSNVYVATLFSPTEDVSTTAVVRLPLSLSFMPTPTATQPAASKEAAVDCTVMITDYAFAQPVLTSVLGSTTLTAEQIEAASSATWPEPAELLLGNWSTTSAAPNNVISGTDNVATVAGSWAVAAGGVNSDNNYNPEVWVANYLNGTLQPWKRGTNLPGMTSSSTTTTYTPESLPYSSQGNVLALAGSATSGLTGTGNRYSSFKTYTASFGQDGTMGAWVRQADLPYGSTQIATSTTVSTSTIGTLSLSDTSGFPQSGFVNVTHGGLVYTGSYSGISGNTLTGVQLIWGSALSLTTSNGDKVVSGFMDCYSTFVTLTDTNGTTTDWLLVFSTDNTTVYAGSVDESGSISSWSTITCASPFINGQPSVLSDGATILIINDSAKQSVIATVSYDNTTTPTFSAWKTFPTPYTNVQRMVTLGVFSDNILIGYKDEDGLGNVDMATVGIDLACRNTSNNSYLHSYYTSMIPAPLLSRVWAFSNFDGTYGIFGMVSTGGTTSVVQTTAYQVAWVNVPIELNTSLTAFSSYFVVIEVSSTSLSSGLNMPVIHSAGTSYTLTSPIPVPPSTTLTWTDVYPDTYIPMQVWGGTTMPSGADGPLMALVSDAGGADTKVTYLYIGPTDRVLYGAGEWTNHERGFFTLTYDDNNALTEITEVS